MRPLLRLFPRGRAGWRACCALGLALGLGCSQRPAEGPPGDDRARALAAAELELGREEKELGGLMAQAQAVECPRAFLLRDNICALAARICALAESAPADRSAPARCQDARTRCQGARVRVAVPCPEPAPPGR